MFVAETGVTVMGVMEPDSAGWFQVALAFVCVEVGFVLWTEGLVQRPILSSVLA